MDTKIRSIRKILTGKAPATVAIFNKGDFYTCYGVDAILIAKEIFISDACLKRVDLGDEEVPSMVMNSGQYNRVIRDLLLMLKHRVEVYEEYNGVYNLAKKGVLGNLGDFEELVQDSVELAELSTIMAIKIFGDDDDKVDNRISISFCNAQDLRITVTEFIDSPLFSQLEHCIVSMAPRECLIFKDDENRAPERCKRLATALNRSNVPYVLINGSTTNVEKNRDDVRSLLLGKFKVTDLSDSSWLAIRTLVDYMQLLDDERYLDKFTFVNYRASGFMHLDNAALRALEVFSVNYDQDSAIEESGSLYEFLNKCRSNPGKRLLREWLRRPLCDLRQIQERLDIVEALTEDHSTRQILYNELLWRIPDIANLARRLVTKKATLRDCYRLYQLVLLLKRFVGAIEDLKNSNPLFEPAVKDLLYEPLLHSDHEFAKYVELIEHTIDLVEVDKSDEFRIKPDISPDLLKISARIDEIKRKVERVHRKVSSEIDNVKLEYSNEYGYCLRLPLKDEKTIRGLRDYTIFKSVKSGGGVLFVNKELEATRAELLELNEEYSEGQSALSSTVISTCAGYVEGLQKLSATLGLIDVLVAFSSIVSSSQYNYVRPELHEKGSGIFELTQCRHPVLESLPNLQFIPNDVRFHYASENPAGVKPRFMVLTGANMGGKSTYLRSAALSVLLAHVGCFVPCDYARLSIMDGIYTRIGAGDFQCKGVSTFMAEMVDCASILESATQNSLIIIDELGRGTSTYDGFGLAWAISEDIIDRIKCFCLFATHFHELSQLQERYISEVRNFKVDTHIDEEGKLVILYRVLEGITDRSFGLNIAELVGFPDHVLKNAGEILRSLESSLETNHDSKASGATDYTAIIDQLKKTDDDNLREAILNLIPADI